MNGARVGITAARRAEEQASIVRALGGVPLIGSSLDVDRPAPDPAVAADLRRALAAPPDVVVFMTGIGARHTMDVAERRGLEGRWRGLLEGGFVLARGAKARRALRALSVRVDAIADPPESRGVLAFLADRGVAGTRITVQCAGPAPDLVCEPLRRLGATVDTVHPYDIAPPRDDAGAIRLARAALGGEVDALTFTSANAVHGFMSLTDRAGIDTAPLAGGPVAIVAVGAVTRQALLDHGMRVDVEPATPRMGAMYHALAAHLAARGPA